MVVCGCMIYSVWLHGGGAVWQRQKDCMAEGLYGRGRRTVWWGLYGSVWLYDQINLYRGRGLSDSHELSLFLQLYNGHPWRRDTGKSASTQCYQVLYMRMKLHQYSAASVVSPVKVFECLFAVA